MAKNDKRFKKNIHIFILALSIYGIIVSSVVLIYTETSDFNANVKDDVKPIDYFTNDTTLPAEWENPNASRMFDVQVVVLSNIQTDTSVYFCKSAGNIHSKNGQPDLHFWSNVLDETDHHAF
jgi:hypothetical protein